MGNPESPNLLRAMGRWTLTALIINSIIGSGIFGLPSVVAGYLGRQSPLAYLVAAAGTGVVIACLAELASQYGEAGGPYLYARDAFGRPIGIEVGLFSLALRATTGAAGANLFVDYLVEFWPSAHKPSPRLVVLTLLIGLIAVVNIRGVKFGAAANNVFTVAKLTPLILFAVAGGVFLLTHHSAAPALAQSSSSSAARNWFNAVLVLTFSYGGFDAAVVPMSEAKDPRRDAPFALFVALGVVTLVYCTIQFVVVSVLPDAAMTNRPLADAARQLGGAPAASLISLGALISVYGYLTATFLHTPRLTFALAQQGDFPAVFARVHPRYRTPHISILAFTAVLWCLAAAGSFKWNVYLSSVTRLLVYGFTCAALPILRRRRPNAGSYRLPGGNVFGVIGILFVALLASRIPWGEQIVVATAVVIPVANWIRSRELVS